MTNLSNVIQSTNILAGAISLSCVFLAAMTVQSESTVGSSLPPWIPSNSEVLPQLAADERQRLVEAWQVWMDARPGDKAEAAKMIYSHGTHASMALVWAYVLTPAAEDVSTDALRNKMLDLLDADGDVSPYLLGILTLRIKWLEHCLDTSTLTPTVLSIGELDDIVSYSQDFGSDTQWERARQFRARIRTVESEFGDLYRRWENDDGLSPYERDKLEAKDRAKHDKRGFNPAYIACVYDVKMHFGTDVAVKYPSRFRFVGDQISPTAGNESGKSKNPTDRVFSPDLAVAGKSGEVAAPGLPIMDQTDGSEPNPPKLIILAALIAGVAACLLYLRRDAHQR